MGRDGVEIVLELHIQNGASGMESLNQLLNSGLVDPAFLFDELLV